VWEAFWAGCGTMRGRIPNDKLVHSGTEPNKYGSHICKKCGEEFRLKYSLLNHKCPEDY